MAKRTIAMLQLFVVQNDCEKRDGLSETTQLT